MYKRKNVGINIRNMVMVFYKNYVILTFTYFYNLIKIGK